MFVSSRLLSGLLFAAVGAGSLSGCGSKSEELPVNTKDLSSGYAPEASLE